MGKRHLNLGIVGCGDIAGYTAALSRLVSPLRLAACCDIRLEQTQAFARRHNIPRAYRDFEELLSHPGLDAVYIATPHNLHARMIAAACEVGKAVLVEKPLTRTLAEAQALALFLQNHPNKVGVNYQYRYDSRCYALARAAQAGALGKIHAIRVNVPWRRTQAYFDQSPWHKTIAQAGGGTLITQGSHFLDIALWAAGSRVVSASGVISQPGGFENIEVETLAQGIVRLQNGAAITITSSMASAKEQPATIEVYGENGTGIYQQPGLVGFTGGVRFHFDSPTHSAGFKPQRPPTWGVHALHRSLAAFTQWALEPETTGPTSYLSPALSTIPVLEVVDAIYRSAANGGTPVEIAGSQQSSAANQPNQPQ